MHHLPYDTTLLISLRGFGRTPAKGKRIFNLQNVRSSERLPECKMIANVLIVSIAYFSEIWNIRNVPSNVFCIYFI